MPEKSGAVDRSITTFAALVALFVQLSFIRCPVAGPCRFAVRLLGAARTPGGLVVGVDVGVGGGVVGVDVGVGFDDAPMGETVTLPRSLRYR